MPSKICTKCKESKELTEFSKRKASKDGVQTYCKICDRDWRKTNPEKVKESRAKYYKKNSEKVKELVAKWIKDNPKRVKESRAKWVRNNPESIKRKIATRKDRIIQATPPWITKTQLVEIKAFYTMCKEENKKIKDPKNKLSVNHLIPIVY